MYVDVKECKYASEVVVVVDVLVRGETCVVVEY